MNDKDTGIGGIRIFGLIFGRLTLVRIAGVVFALSGTMHLADELLANDTVIWWKLVFGVALIAFGIVLLVARPADPQDKQ